MIKKSLLSILSLGFLFTKAQPSPSWTNLQNSNFPVTAAGIKFLDAVDQNVVWAFGYDGMAPNRNYNWVTRSIDGGLNFSAAPIVASTLNPAVGDTSKFVFANLDAIDANTCWASAYEKTGGGSKGGVFRTTNGGTSWQQINAANMYTNAASFCNLVTFVTSQVGIIQGDAHPGTGNEYEIWRTTDGGNTWNLVPGANIPNPTSGEYGLVNVYEKLPPNHIWFGTNKGRMFRSNDGGLNWNVSTVTAASLAANAQVTEIAFSDANNGLCLVFVGAAPNFTPHIYNTNDGGVTWTLAPQPIDPNFGLNDVCRIPGTNQIASAGAGTGNQLISYTNNNGNSWNDWGSSGIQYLTVDFVSPEVGWAGTFSDLTNSSIGGIYKYTGPSINNNAYAAFTMMGMGCAPATFTVNNYSTGSPANSYTWTVFPPGPAISNSTAANPTFTFSAANVYTVTLIANNGSGNSQFIQVVNIAACTGIEEANNPLYFGVYPNPSKGNITLKMENGTSGFRYSVYNVMGKNLYSSSLINSDMAQINLENQPAGLYFLTVEKDGQKLTQKIIIE